MAAGGLRWTLALDMRPWRFIFIARLVALLAGCASGPKPVSQTAVRFRAINRLTLTNNSEGGGSTHTYAHPHLQAVRTAFGHTNLYDLCGNMIAW